MDITMSEASCSSPAAKKRKLQSGWGLLKERLTGTPYVPWLVISTCISINVLEYYDHYYKVYENKLT